MYSLILCLPCVRSDHISNHWFVVAEMLNQPSGWGKKILFFQRSFIPFFQVAPLLPNQSKDGSLPATWITTAKAGKTEACSCNCLCVCLRVHVFYQVMNSESNNTGPVNGDLLYFGSLCTCTHAHWHFNLSLSQHARGAPHDADVVNSGMK